MWILYGLINFNYNKRYILLCKHRGISKLNPGGDSFRMLGISIPGRIHEILEHHSRIIIA